MFNRPFMLATAERMVRAAAAAIVALLAADGADVIGGVDLAAAGYTALIAAIASGAMALAGGAIGSGHGPSFTGAENTAPSP